MKKHFVHCAAVSLLALVTFGVAHCSAAADAPSPYQTSDGGMDSSATDSANTDSSKADTGTPGDSSVMDVGPNEDASTTEAILYAHTGATLFRADQTNGKFAIKSLGDFDCIDIKTESITDIAVDKDGRVFGVSKKSVFLGMTIGSGTVHCTSKPLSAGLFMGLTFAPQLAGLGKAGETLIGANTDGELYMIDTTTGNPTLVGKFGKVPANDGQGNTYPKANQGQNWELSGDIVFLSNGDKQVGFATLRDCPNPPDQKDCSEVDTLVEIDVSLLNKTTPVVVTKSIKGMILREGCTSGSATCGFASTFGIAALNDKVYGFTKDGLILSVDNSTGKATQVGNFASELGTYGFYGAGITTVAPFTPPK